MRNPRGSSSSNSFIYIVLAIGAYFLYKKISLNIPMTTTTCPIGTFSGSDLLGNPACLNTPSLRVPST